MNQRDYDISGALTFWSLQPTPYSAVKWVLDDLGYGGCVPNPRTDHSALENSIKSVYGTKDKTVVSRKKSKRNGVELVAIERNVDRNYYTTSFGAKVVDGRIKADYGHADEYRLTDEFLKCKAVLTQAAMSKALADVLTKMDGMKGFDKAGIYYVPEHWLTQWKRLSERIEACREGNSITTVRAAMDDGASRAIRDALSREVQEEAIKLLDDVSKGTLNDAQLDARADKAQALVDRVNLYSAILSEGLEGLKNVALLAQGAAAAAAMQSFAQAGIGVGV